MKTLLTFTGFHDPYNPGLVDGQEQPGPILSLVGAKKFDKVILFSTPGMGKNTAGTEAALRSLHPASEVEVIELPLYDPTDYAAILKGLRESIGEILGTSGDYFISVASGTPQMHACWLLLAASGEIPARLLHVRPPKYVSKDKPLVSEVDLTSPDFPVVRSEILKVDALDYQATDIIVNLGIVGDHPEIKRAVEIAAMLAPSAVPALITGETGTGKELIAKLIHYISGRKEFVAINCAAIPGELVESTLFGHKRGSFTGAISDQKGKFELADGGTLFLDELGELPLVTQAKMLRILQDGIVEPIGAKVGHRVDVRIVAATNQNLAEAIRKGRFREDLYYRLEVGRINLPPLRERRSDIPKIALHALDRINSTLKRRKRISPDALKKLQNHSWPGNVRELNNAIERTVMLTRHDVIEPEDLMISDAVSLKDPLFLLPEPQEGFSLEGFLTEARRRIMTKALETSGGNQSEAARLLGISPQAVHKFLHKTEV